MNSVAYTQLFFFFFFCPAQIRQFCKASVTILPKGLPVGPQDILRNFFLTIFISVVKKKIRYLRSSHCSVSMWICWLKNSYNHLFLGKKKEIFSDISSPQKQQASWIIGRELPKANALKNNCMQRRLAYQQAKKEIFFY